MPPAHALDRCEPREGQKIGERRHPDVWVKKNVETLIRDEIARAIQIVGYFDIPIGVASDRIAKGVGVLRRPHYDDLEAFARELLDNAVVELSDRVLVKTGRDKPDT